MSIPQGNLYRSAQLQREQINEQERTIEIPVSSEYAVERWYGLEVLQHGEQSVDLSRFQNGAPFLWVHSPEDYIGVIERAYIQSKRLFCRVRFDTHELAEKIWQSVLGGVLRNVSIGYQIMDAREELENKVQKYIATRWQPYEASMVTIPADPTVGVGRSQRSPVVDPKAALVIVEERTRFHKIQTLCREFGLPSAFEQFALQEDMSFEQVQIAALNRLLAN